MQFKFSFKGATLLFGGIFAVNILIATFFTSLGLSDAHATIIANAIFSSLIVNVVVTFVDGTFSGYPAFFKRYAFFALCFAILSYLWSK